MTDFHSDVQDHKVPKLLSLNAMARYLGTDYNTFARAAYILQLRRYYSTNAKHHTRPMMYSKFDRDEVYKMREQIFKVGSNSVVPLNQRRRFVRDHWYDKNMSGLTLRAFVGDRAYRIAKQLGLPIPRPIGLPSDFIRRFKIRKSSNDKTAEDSTDR